MLRLLNRCYLDFPTVYHNVKRQFFFPAVLINYATWNCYYNNSSVSTDFVNIKPGVCAYILQVLDSVWLCQAPGPACWTWGHTCTGGSSNAPGEDQIGCRASEVSWCCWKDWEVCSGVENQTNVCWASTFRNPLFAIDPSSPNASVSAAIVLQQQGIATVSPPVSPSGGVAGSAAPASFGSPKNATNATCGPPPGVAKLINNGHAKGAIIGTVIGGLLALGLIMNAVLWIMRIKHRRRVRRKVLETGARYGVQNQRNVAVPSPSTTPKRSTSQQGLRERSGSQRRTASAGSEHYRPNDFDFKTESGNFGNPQSAKKLSEESSRRSPSTEMKTPSPAFWKSSPPIVSPTLQPHAIGERTKFRNVTDVYDAPEDPVDLEGVVTFERRRREVEKLTRVRQQQWME